MPNCKWLFPLVASGFLIGTAVAEPNRPLFSLENNFPRWEQLEAGLTYGRVDGTDESYLNSQESTSLYLRYGVLENMALVVDIPFVSVDPKFGSSESGLGDVILGIQLRTYEDIFGYPYFIPYVYTTLPTGDEDKGLGSEDPVVTGGLSYGTKINNWIGWVLDVGYRINSNEENQLIVGNSYIWEISEEFALLTEILYEEEIENGDESTVLVSGGFTYDWSRRLNMGVSIFGGLNGPADVGGQFRLSFSF